MATPNISVRTRGYIEHAIATLKGLKGELPGPAEVRDQLLRTTGKGGSYTYICAVLKDIKEAEGIDQKSTDPILRQLSDLKASALAGIEEQYAQLCESLDKRESLLADKEVQIQRNIDAVTSEIEAVRSENEELRARLTALEEKLSTTHDRLDEASQKNVALLGEISELKVENTALFTSNRENRSMIEVLKKSLHENIDDNSSKQSIIKKLTELLANETMAKQAINETLDVVLTQLANQSSSIQNMDDNLQRFELLSLTKANKLKLKINKRKP